jgi:hypothetical protein
MSDSDSMSDYSLEEEESQESCPIKFKRFDNDRDMENKEEEEEDSQSSRDSDSDSDSDSNSESELELPSYDEIKEIVNDRNDYKVLELWQDQVPPRSDEFWFENLCTYLKSRNIMACEMARFSSGFLEQTMHSEF